MTDDLEGPKNEDVSLKDHYEKIRLRYQKDYLGFIVIKPLPSVIIGRTCLKTYPQNSINSGKNKRTFPILRNYRATFYGLPLTIESLAFQEQDKIVSACATSAVWSTIQGTAILFQHSLPSPAEITQIAAISGGKGERPFPNEGLDARQMALVMQSLGLYPLLIDPKQFKSEMFLGFIYAYLRCRLPIILNFTRFPKNKGRTGDHAVVITGYQERTERTDSVKDCIQNTKGREKVGDHSLPVIAETINKLYVHDDTIGPFARIHARELQQIHIDTYEGIPKEKYKIKGDKENRFGSLGFEYDSFDRGNLPQKQEEPASHDYFALPTSIIIPLHKKMRITYPDIHQFCNRFNQFYSQFQTMFSSSNHQDTLYRTLPIHGWDIYLNQIQDYKREAMSDPMLSGGLRVKLTSQHLPKYLWIAKAEYYDAEMDKIQRLFQFVFDATDVKSEDFLISFLAIDSEHRDFILDTIRGDFESKYETCQNLEIDIFEKNLDGNGSKIEKFDIKGLFEYRNFLSLWLDDNVDAEKGGTSFRKGRGGKSRKIELMRERGS